MVTCVAASALEFSADIESITDVGAVNERFMREINKYGLYHVNSGEIPPVGGDMAQFLHISTMPEEYSRRYLERQYVSRDPVAIATTKCSHPFSWEALCSPRLFKPRDLAIMYEPREWGIRDGIVAPQRTADGTLGIVSVAGEKIDMSDREKSALLFMMGSLYAHFQGLVGSQMKCGSPYPALTQRERECLQWVADGESDWSISEKLKIAESTVHNHIENAKRKYEVSTRVQAVVLAMKSGDIYP